MCSLLLLEEFLGSLCGCCSSGHGGGLDAVSTGSNEVCGISSSALRGVGFVFNLAMLIDSGADESTGQVGSAACVSPSPLAVCFLLPFCCKLRCSCLGSSAVQSAFPFQSYLVEQSCPGGPCLCHWDSTQPAVLLLLETVLPRFQRLQEESPGEAQLRAHGGYFAEQVAGCKPCEMRVRLVVLFWGSVLVVPELCEVSACAHLGAGFFLAQHWVLFQLPPTTVPSSIPWVPLHFRGSVIAEWDQVVLGTLTRCPQPLGLL